MPARKHTALRRLVPLTGMVALILGLSALVAAAPPAAAAETPLPNPTVPKQCGLDVTLVLDASGSVNTSHAVEDVRTAAKSFLDAFQDTNSTARVLQFATISEELAARALVTEASMENDGYFADAVKGYYNPIPPRPSGVEIKRFNGGNPNQAGSWSSSNSSNMYTNWNQTLAQAAGDAGDLVVFITDGDPTAYDFDQSGDPFDAGPPPDVGVGTDRTAASAAITLDRAVVSANAVKTTGSRVLAIGVGNALQNNDSVQRLTQVSGDDVARTSAEFDIETTDVALVEDFGDLAAAARKLVLELCSPSLTIRKFAQSASDATYQPRAGWDITVTPSVDGGTFSWVLPTGATGASATQTTNADGYAQYQWDPDPDEASSSALVAEEVQSGFVAGRPAGDDYRCQLKDADGGVREVVGEVTVDGDVATFTLDPIGLEIVTCSLWNSFDYQPAINIEKANDPSEVRGDLSPPTAVGSTFTVTNPGNTPLANVVVTDDKCAPVRPVPAAAPDDDFNVGDTNTDDLLDPDESWQFTCERATRSSVGGPQGINVVNTATVHGTDPTGAVVTDQATDDVDVFIPLIELTKLVNGEPSVTVPSGSEVTYTYVATNTGNTPLADVELVDDTPPCEDPVRGPDDPGNGDAILDLGESWTFSCTAAPTENVLNTATVTGTPLNPVTDEEFAGDNPDVTDTATAQVTVVDPALLLTKTVDQDLVFPDTDVTYTYTATNNGDTDLRNDTGNPGWVSDDRCSPVEYASGDDGDELLNPQESWQFTCVATITEQTINTATIEAQPIAEGEPIGDPLIREAQAVVRVLVPAIELTKTALIPVVLDPDAQPVSGPDVPTPRQARYAYQVRNAGTVPIRDVELTDDRCPDPALASGDVNENAVLDVGEVWEYTCATALEREQAQPPPQDESGLVTNHAEVVGTPYLPTEPEQVGDPISAEDQAQVLVIEPSLELTKTASSDVVRVGRTVTYTFAVTNTGDVGLGIIGPTDDKCEPLTFTGGDDNGNDLIDGANTAQPETWTYTCTRAIELPPEGETVDTNTASVIGVDPLGNSYQDTDSAEVRVLDPAIRLVKSVSDSIVPVGTEVTYTFEVTNVGTSPVPTDDLLAQVTLIDAAVPAAPQCRRPVLVGIDGDDGDDFLDRVPAETWRYTCQATIDDPTTNVAVVAAIGGTQYQLRIPVFDYDVAFVQPFHPGIEVVKSADPTELAEPGPVTYTYHVRNTGDVPLAGVAERITDDTCSPVTYQSGDLDSDELLDTPRSIFEDAADETWVFTCTTTIAETTTNVVVVTGSPSDPDGVGLCGPADGPGDGGAEVGAERVAEPCDVTDDDAETVVLEPPGPPLPQTGSSIQLSTALAGAALLVLGAAALAVARRRARGHA